MFLLESHTVLSSANKRRSREVALGASLAKIIKNKLDNIAPCGKPMTRFDFLELSALMLTPDDGQN